MRGGCHWNELLDAKKEKLQNINQKEIYKAEIKNNEDNTNKQENKKIFSDNSTFLEIPESETQDIDNEEDWKIAEIKYQILNKNG